MTRALSPPSSRRRPRGGVAFIVLAAALGCHTTGAPGALVPPTVAEDAALPREDVTIGGRAVRLHVRHFGAPGAPLLVLLHGGPGADSRQFLPFAAVSERYHVLTYDQHGSGLSERVGDDLFELRHYIEELDALVARHGGGAPATLVGHSWGASLAAAYTGRHPDRVRELFLFEPGALSGAAADEFRAKTSADVLGRDVQRALWVDQLLSRDDDEQADFAMLSLLVGFGTKGYVCREGEVPEPPLWRGGARAARATGERVTDDSLGAGVGAFRGRVVLVGGTCSAIGPAFQAKHHQPLFTSAEVGVLTIDNAGHFVFSERRNDVLALLRRELAEHRRPP